MIRSTEAVIASVLMLGSLIYIFNVPTTEADDPTEQHIRSLLGSYSDVAKFLGTTDPYTLKLLIEAAMPRGYNQKITFNYFKRLITFTGIGSAPTENYMIIPMEGKTSFANSEVKSNWYRSIFQITNTGSSSITGQTSVSASLYKPDVTGDSLSDPLDLDSLMVFTDEGQLNSSIYTYEDYFNRTVVGLYVDIALDAGETENLYIYYLVGDDYE